MRPVVVTYASHPEHATRLVTGLAALGWDCRVVGAGEPWRGWASRLKATVAECEKARADGYSHAVSVDSFDVIPQQGPWALPAALAHYGDPPLLLAAEAACWPPCAEREAKHPKGESRWRYAHSQYVVRLDRLDLLRAADMPGDADDQRWLMDTFLAGTAGVALDTGCRFLQSVAHSSPWENFFELRGDRVIGTPDIAWVRNRLTGSEPLFVHGNGRTDISWVPVPNRMPQDVLAAKLLAAGGLGDKATIHTYDAVYGPLLGPRRHGVRRVLEVGVRDGSSLRAWADYFPSAEVWGIDNGEEMGLWTPPPELRERVKVFHLDSTDRPAVIKWMVHNHLAVRGSDYRGFDVIIDDGSHKPADQIATFDAIWPLVEDGGIWVTEDLEGPVPAQEVNAVVGGVILDRRHVKGRHDDILIVRIKGASA